MDKLKIEEDRKVRSNRLVIFGVKESEGDSKER